MPMDFKPQVVLLTDLGRDVNDVLALQILAKNVRQEKAGFAGILTCGGNSKKRALLAREWVRQLGMRDSQVPVAFSNSKGNNTCFVPSGFHLPSKPTLYSSRYNASSDLLLSLARKHKSELVIVATGPLTAVADALVADKEGVLKRIGAMYIQGSATVSEHGVLEPSFEASNLREDMAAARAVFAALQGTVPFHFVGMHSAVVVPLMRDDFIRWDRKLQEVDAVGAHSSDGLCMVALARHNLELLRQQNPQLLYDACCVPPERRNEHEWFDDVQELAVPYDALAVLRLLEPALFEPRWIGHHSLCGVEEDDHGLRDVSAAHEAVVGSVLEAAGMIVDWRETVKVLMITDIGRDLDDALALQTLTAHVVAGEAELVGVVTSGGNSNLKAGVARGWLRLLGFHDLDVLVAFGRAKGRKAVLSPPGFPSPKQAALASDKPEDAAEAILRLAGQHRGALRIVVIGAMTPLADALAADKEGLLKGVGGIFLQGHPEVYGYGANVTFKPSVDVLNMKEDFDAAVNVFEELQDHVPFHFVGKYAGNTMYITRKDIAAWDEQLRAGNAEGAAPLCMLDLARESLDMLHATNAELAYHRYKVPADKRNKTDWFDSIQQFPVLHDAITVLRFTAPEFFLPQWFGRHSVCGGVPDDDEVDPELMSNLISAREVRDKLAACISESFRILTQVANHGPSNMHDIVSGTPVQQSPFISRSPSFVEAHKRSAPDVPNANSTENSAQKPISSQARSHISTEDALVAAAAALKSPPLPQPGLAPQRRDSGSSAVAPQVGLETHSSAASAISIAGSGTPMSRCVISRGSNPDAQVHELGTPITLNTRSGSIAKTMPRIDNPSVTTARRNLGYDKSAKPLPERSVMDKVGSSPSKLPTTSMRQILANGASPIAKTQWTPRSLPKDSCKSDRRKRRPLAKAAKVLLGIMALVVVQTKATTRKVPRKLHVNNEVPEVSTKVESQRNKQLVFPFMQKFSLTLPILPRQ